MVYPNILPPSIAAAAASTSGGSKPTPHPPRVEYVATLVKHAGAVNVVRFSPSGEYLASAGDDGMIIIWMPTDRPVHTFGADPEEAQYEKEHWKPKIVLRCTSREVYDLAWSPNGEYIIAGSTDNTARVYNAADGTCVREIAEHNHYVQGVAWDPLNEYVASQSSDRSVHVYGISTKRGSFDVNAVGKNSRITVRHSRTPSAATTTSGRPTHKRRGSASASEAESVAPTSISELKEDQLAAYIAATNPASFNSMPPISSSSTAATPSTSAAPLLPTPSGGPAPPTPTMSVMSTPSMKPPKDRPTSRRSSFSGSAAPSPAQSARHIGRSPSPMPPLPAIRQPQSSSASWATFKMYGDEGYTNFFRRLTFSPDGAFLLTPAGHFEDTSVVPSSSSKGSSSGKNGGGAAVDDPPSRPKKGTRASESSGGSKSSVYIYSRANFSRPPIAHLPGHQKASVAVKFSPLLYELRQGVVGGAGEEREKEVKRIGIERGKDQVVDLDLGGAVGGAKEATRSSSSTSESGSGPVAPSPSPSAATPERPIYAPAPRRPPSASPSLIGQRESDASDRRAPTPAQTPSMMMNALTPAATGSVFALPYRMLYSVATQDTIVVYDTQQAGPVCLFTNLHYASFTDMAWAPDGQSLMLASSDGYCSIVVFDDILPLYHTQQHNLQLQSIVNSHNSTVSPQHHREHSFSQQQGLMTPHSPALSFTSSIVRGGTPSLSSRELPQQQGGSLGLTSVGGSTSTQQRGRQVERSESMMSTASSNAPPVPALGLHGLQGPSSSSSSSAVHMAQQSTGVSVPSSAAESGNESDVAPPAKKRRRIALTHHVDTE